MKLSIVVAASTNNVIGNAGSLPWHLPEDLQRFRHITMGKPIVMGRRTFESIGRALPGRRNVVLSRQPDFTAEGCEVVHSREATLRLLRDEDEVMIIGGGIIYEQFLPQVRRIYLTRVAIEISGDTTFPELASEHWQTVAREEFPVSEDRAIAFAIETLMRY